MWTPRGSEYSFSVAVVGDHVDLALTLGDFAVLDDAIDFADDRGLARLARLEQFDHARQTAGDVLGLGGFARDLGQHVAGVDRVAVLHHQVGVRRHQVALAGLAFDHDRRLALLVRRIRHHVTRQAGDFVHLLVQRDAFLQVLEMHRAADFGEDGEGVGIPLEQDLALLDRIAVVDLELGAVNHRVAFALAALLVDHGNRSLAVHDHQIARLRLDRLHADELHEAVVFGVLRRLLGDSRRRAADVEGTHGELRAGFADGLRRDDAHRLAAFDQPSGRQVAAVAHDANAALRFAGQHRTDLHPLDTGRLNRARQVFGDLLVDVDDHVAVVVVDLLERHAADDAVAQRLDDFARFDDRPRRCRPRCRNRIR